MTAPSETPSRCQPSFDATPRSFGPDGGAGSVAVTVARECSWSASSGSSWVVITAGSQGQGDGTVTFRVDRNPDPVSRGSAIVLGDARLDVAQQAAPCAFDVSRPTEAVASGGGAIQVQIRTHTVCEWTAASESAWVTVAPAAGRGTATVSLTVPVNTGSARSGVVVVAGQRVEVTQSATVPGPTPPAPPPTPPPAPPPPAPQPPPPPPPAPPPPEQLIELSGKVAELSGSCPILRFEIKGTVVVTTVATAFTHGSCRDVKKGREVIVIGVRLGDGTVEAREVNLNGKDETDANLLDRSEYSVDRDDRRCAGDAP